MDTLYSPATVAKLIKDHDFRFAKSLGQNFLIDGNIVNKIMEAGAVGPEDFVIEIGTGLGVLTRAVAEQGARITSVEIDERLFPILSETLGDLDNVRLIKGDFLKMSLKEMIDEANSDVDGKQAVVKIMGNLPYYISTPVIMKVLEENARDGLAIQSLTIMVQKEVGERLKAVPGGKDYGILSIAVQYYTEVTQVIMVPRTVFMPKPSVDSMVLNLKILDRPSILTDSSEIFFKLVRKAFGQRRKTLLNALTGIDGLSKMEVSGLLEEAGVDGGRRPETLSLEEFGAVSNILANRDI